MRKNSINRPVETRFIASQCIMSLKKTLIQNANAKKAESLQRFFKTGKGEYGEGDVFLGITVPVLRKISKEYYDLNFNNLQNIISSEIHEERLSAIFILLGKYKHAVNDQEKKNIFNYYVKNRKYINNWDLVDLSASYLVGDYLFTKDRSLLYKWAQSKHLWSRRIAIVATHYFIRNNDFKDTLCIAEELLNDDHDLIHKATGWMLREVGKRDVRALERFLQKHYKKMPRTMLRYAIEKFPESKRQYFLVK